MLLASCCCSAILRVQECLSWSGLNVSDDNSSALAIIVSTEFSPGQSFALNTPGR